MTEIEQSQNRAPEEPHNPGPRARTSGPTPVANPVRAPRTAVTMRPQLHIRPAVAHAS
ncbi:hypothetical protein [Streptomyces tailanensis]|uniref:hypothetical protein n=1 Tax=Streptomyces tailanensis TaxID=2569858 RepID=UPI00155A2652|nr:hypothetical protein [Streptomyces tailanensis]